MVRRFVSEVRGKFSSEDVCIYCAARTRPDKNAVYQALSRMNKTNKIRRLEEGLGVYEPVESNPEEMDLSGMDGEPVDLKMPLGIHKLARIYPGSIVLVAGETNTGKTAFMLSTIAEVLTGSRTHKNPLRGNKNYRLPLGNFSTTDPPCYEPFNNSTLQNNDGETITSRNNTPPQKNIRYLNCEMGRTELTARIKMYGLPLGLWTQHVAFLERHGLFHQVMLPDGLTVVDYLDVTQDFFEAAHLMSQIHEALDTGVAIVAMQKNPEKKHAIGGAQTLAKPRLAINLLNNDPYGGIAQLIKVKEPADWQYKPQGRECDYIIVNGRFRPLSGWRYVSKARRQKINRRYAKQLKESQLQDLILDQDDQTQNDEVIL